MRSIYHLTLLTAVGAAAQRPNNTSACDFYTTALFKDNNATNQETLVTLLVNTAVIGNYTKPNTGVAVPGILAKNATYNGTAVDLLPYFNGALASNNRGGSAGVSINFLDDGGATPLLHNKPSNGTASAQYKLLTHLYGYFGILLGCSQYGQSGFATYTGTTSMYQVHKFMALNAHEVQYFIQQVGLSALSFGVAESDVALIGHALQYVFGFRCAPKYDVVPGANAELQSICITSDCPVSANATCSAYASVPEPKHTNGSVMVNGTAAPSGTGAANSTSTSKSGVGLAKEVCGGLLVSFALLAVTWAF